MCVHGSVPMAASIRVNTRQFAERPTDVGETLADLARAAWWRVFGCLVPVAHRQPFFAVFESEVSHQFRPLSKPVTMAGLHRDFARASGHRSPCRARSGKSPGAAP